MKRTDRLSVFFDDGKDGSSKQLVGTLALYQNRYAAFSYSDSWLSGGFSISPFSLPLEKKVFVPDWEPFGGLHGIFNDSLPDGWGRLLVDRMLLKNHIQPESLSVLDRLAIVGSSGMGALTYDTESKSWQLSPAYDLTYSNSIGGEHATTVDGEGATPQLCHILAVAEKNGIKSARAKLIAEEVRETVTQALGTWL